ncbi:RusA family crossover junction endodeoxyribonuclease [Gimesia fumaroli]|nr:RusA family crossover junction endodeoxyribonuclease [Gimesia fumaroli]
MESVKFSVPGAPVAQPRQKFKRMGGFISNYTPEKHPVTDYKKAIRLSALEAYQGKPDGGPIALEVVFVFPRQSNKRWKTKPMPRYLHVQRNDVDNLLKAVMDALNEKIWVDDKQVCKVTATKWRAAGDEEPHTEITIKPINVG